MPTEFRNNTFTGGPCNLTPAKDVDIARLLQYMKQGMIYATMNKPEPALSEFQQALAIDKNFLGLNQNVASALIALKRYTEAESSLKNEIKLIGCLDPLPDTTLSRFAYMMEIQEKDLAKRSLRQAEVLRTQLGKVKALSQYNLACLYSLQKQKRPALDALRDAVKAGFDDQKALNSDPDLSFIRSSPEFKEILSTADKGKR
jgi:tetratricopeptide (TPR) repeat protein